MSAESDLFTVELPSQIGELERTSLSDDIRRVDGVRAVGSMGARGAVDPAMIADWVQVASGLLTVASTAGALLGGVVDRIRRRGIRGARIQLPNGGVVEVDNVSPEELERLVQV